MCMCVLCAQGMNVFVECFQPYCTSDYAGMFDGERARGARGAPYRGGSSGAAGRLGAQVVRPPHGRRSSTSAASEQDR